MDTNVNLLLNEIKSVLSQVEFDLNKDAKRSNKSAKRRARKNLVALSKTAKQLRKLMLQTEESVTA